MFARCCIHDAGLSKRCEVRRDEVKVFVDTENVEIAQVLMEKEIFLWTRSV